MKNPSTQTQKRTSRNVAKPKTPPPMVRSSRGRSMDLADAKGVKCERKPVTVNVTSVDFRKKKMEQEKKKKLEETYMVKHVESYAETEVGSFGCFPFGFGKPKKETKVPVWESKDLRTEWVRKVSTIEHESEIIDDDEIIEDGKKSEGNRSSGIMRKKKHDEYNNPRASYLSLLPADAANQQPSHPDERLTMAVSTYQEIPRVPRTPRARKTKPTAVLEDLEI